MGQKGAVVEVDVIAGDHVGKPEVAGLAGPVADHQVPDEIHHVQRATGGLARGDPDVRPQLVTVRGAGDLGGDGKVEAPRPRQHEGPGSESFVLGRLQLRVVEEVLSTEHAGDGAGPVDQVVHHQVGLVVAHMSRRGPELLVVVVFPLQLVGHRPPLPDHPGRLADHPFVTAGEAGPVQVGQLFALMGVESGERIAAASGRDRVDDVEQLVAQQSLDVEHDREVAGPLELTELAVRFGFASPHEGEGSVPDVGTVLEAAWRSPPATAAAPHVGVVRRSSVDLRRDKLGEASGLGGGAERVDRLLGTGLGIEHVADMAHVGLHHVAPQADDHLQPAEQVAMLVAE